MKALRDPLFHFLVLGAALFLVYALATGFFSSDDVHRIEIGEPEIEFLAGGFERRWARPPTPEELRGLVDFRVREEILYREALAVGLDRDDVVVRRRMVQKMELLTQDLATLADPTDGELRSFFDEQREDYRVPSRLSFSHVYFNTDRRGAAAEEDARRLLAELRAATPPPRRAPERGDSLMVEFDYVLATPHEVRQLFGNRFAEELFELQTGWQGPLVSGYGIHLANVGERVEGRIPDYEEVRERVLSDYDRVRRERANEALYEGLAGKYEVVIESQR